MVVRPLVFVFFIYLLARRQQWLPAPRCDDSLAAYAAYYQAPQCCCVWMSFWRLPQLFIIIIILCHKMRPSRATAEKLTVIVFVWSRIVCVCALRWIHNDPIYLACKFSGHCSTFSLQIFSFSFVITWGTYFIHSRFILLLHIGRNNNYFVEETRKKRKRNSECRNRLGDGRRIFRVYYVRQEN